MSPRTYIGSGKTFEVEGAVDELEADTVIFDDELTPGIGSVSSMLCVPSAPHCCSMPTSADESMTPVMPSHNALWYPTQPHMVVAFTMSFCLEMEAYIVAEHELPNRCKGQSC